MNTTDLYRKQTLSQATHNQTSKALAQRSKLLKLNVTQGH